MNRDHVTVLRTAALASTALMALGFAATVPTPAGAQCTVTGTGPLINLQSGDRVVCTGTTSEPINAAPGSTNVGVTIAPGGTLDLVAPPAIDAVVVRNDSFIAVEDGGRIVTSGAMAVGAQAADDGNRITVNGSGGIETSGFMANPVLANGNNNIVTLNDQARIASTGQNAVGIVLFGSGNAVTLNDSATVSTTGAAAEGIVVFNTGNTVTVNGGTVATQGPASAGVLFVTPAGATNTLVNRGTISSAQSFAVQGGPGDETIRNAGTLSGAGTAVSLFAGDDTLILETGSMINGLINGGSGTDQVILEGTGSEDDSFLNFETLTMRGERWTLSGNSMIPTTQVDSGTLLVNGLLASAVTVNPAGTLGGTGTVAGSVTNTGTVAPGDPGGTLTVDGAYTQTPAGTLEIGIDGTGTADRLAVTGTPGTAALAGTLQVVPLDQVIGDSVTDIVSASGGITGDFDTVVLGPTGRTTLDVGTTGDRVRLVSLSPAGFDSRVAAGTRTGFLFHDVLGSRIDTAQPSAEAGQAATAEAPQQLASAVPIGGLAGAGQSAQLTPTLAAPRAPGTVVLWARPFVRFGDQEMQDNVAGYDFSIGGVALGADTAVTGNLTLGGAVGFARSNIDVDGGFEESQVDGVLFAGYARYTHGPLFAGLAVTGGLNDYDTTRQVTVNGALASADAEYDGYQIGTRLSGGAELPFARGWIARPVAVLDYVLLDQDAYTEAGAGVGDLEVGDDTAHALRATGTVSLRHPVELDVDGGTGTLVPEVRVGFGWETALDDRVLDTQLAAFGTPIRLQGDDSNRAFGILGAGAVLELDNGVGLFAGYDAEFAGEFTAHTVNGGVRVTW